MKPSTAFTSGLVAVILTGSSQAVTLVQSYFDNGNETPPLVSEGGGVYSYTFSSLGGFTAAGADKLVLGFQNKDTGAVAGPPVSAVTYNGIPMNEAIQAASFRQRNSIFFLDNVASDGDLVVKFTDGATSDQTSWTLGLYALDGTAPGFWDTATETHLSSGGDLNDGGASVNVSEDTGFVLNLYARNNGGLELVSPSPPFTEDVDVSVSTSGGNLVSVYASAVVNAPGDYSTVVSGHGGSTPASTMIAAAFNGAPAVVIPEPSSAALFGLGVFGLMLRRKK